MQPTAKPPTGQPDVLPPSVKALHAKLVEMRNTMANLVYEIDSRDGKVLHSQVVDSLATISAQMTHLQRFFLPERYQELQNLIVVPTRVTESQVDPVLAELTEGRVTCLNSAVTPTLLAAKLPPNIPNAPENKPKSPPAHVDEKDPLMGFKPPVLRDMLRELTNYRTVVDKYLRHAGQKYQYPINEGKKLEQETLEYLASIVLNGSGSGESGTLQESAGVPQSMATGEASIARSG